MSNEFVLIDWSINQLYTVFENFKNVKKGDTVTCYVNHVKDIGQVVHVDSEKNCKRLLFQYRQILANGAFNQSASVRMLNASTTSLPQNNRKGFFNQLLSFGKYVGISKNKTAPATPCEHKELEPFISIHHNAADIESQQALNQTVTEQSLTRMECGNCVKMKMRIDYLSKKLAKYEDNKTKDINFEESSY